MQRVTVQAVYKIGPVKADPRRKHAGYPIRHIGDTFVLDIDHPIDRKLYQHLHRNGAIKTISGEVDIDLEPEATLEGPQSLEDIEPIIEEGPTGEVNEEDIKPRWNFDTPIEELGILDEEQCDMMRRIGIETLGELPKRNDSDIIRSIHGVGPKKVRDLRTAYDEAAESYTDEKI